MKKAQTKNNDNTLNKLKKKNKFVNTKFAQLYLSICTVFLFWTTISERVNNQGRLNQINILLCFKFNFNFLLTQTDQLLVVHALVSLNALLDNGFAIRKQWALFAQTFEAHTEASQQVLVHMTIPRIAHPNLPGLIN